MERLKYSKVHIKDGFQHVQLHVMFKMAKYSYSQYECGFNRTLFFNIYRNVAKIFVIGWGEGGDSHNSYLQIMYAPLF
jgi:hypothetical protein